MRTMYVVRLSGIRYKYISHDAFQHYPFVCKIHLSSSSHLILGDQTFRVKWIKWLHRAFITYHLIVYSIFFRFCFFLFFCSSFLISCLTIRQTNSSHCTLHTTNVFYLFASSYPSAFCYYHSAMDDFMISCMGLSLVCVSVCSKIQY